MDKRSLSERDICTKFITPALRRAGWDEMLQIREEVSFTKGRIIVRGKLVTRGQAKRADYCLGRTIRFTMKRPWCGRCGDGRCVDRPLKRSLQSPSREDDPFRVDDNRGPLRRFGGMVCLRETYFSGR